MAPLSPERSVLTKTTTQYSGPLDFYQREKNIGNPLPYLQIQVTTHIELILTLNNSKTFGQRRGANSSGKQTF